MILQKKILNIHIQSLEGFYTRPFFGGESYCHIEHIYFGPTASLYTSLQIRGSMLEPGTLLHSPFHFFKSHHDENSASVGRFTK